MNTETTRAGSKRIYLQPGQATDPSECTLSHVGTERVTEADVEYVRDDLVKELIEAAKDAMPCLYGTADLSVTTEKAMKAPNVANRLRSAMSALE